MASSPIYEYVGNLHMHTIYSDGEGTHADIARAAQAAGIDFVVVTDHNVLVKGVEGYYGDDEQGHVLLLTGEEIHDQMLQPAGNHLLAYGHSHEVAQCATEPQVLIDAVNAAGGSSFIAHPHDPLLELSHFRDHGYTWRDWSVKRFTGLEIWNYMSSFKGVLPNWKQTLRAAFRPELFIDGPQPETLALWDKLLAEGNRVVGIGNSDAHGTTFKVGPLKHVIFPYDFLFNCVNTHVLLSQPLTGNWQRDQVLIYRAVSQGNCFIGYDLPGDTRGFRYSANGQHGITIMGGSLRMGAGVTLQALAPARCRLKMVCDGKVVEDVTNRENLTYTAQTPGAYRVEVWREYLGKERCWILSNPIYIE